MKTPLLALTIAGSTLLANTLSARPEGRPTPPEPETVVVEMFTDYDTNENDSLSQDELVAALTGIREKHQADRPGNRPGMKRAGPDGDSDNARKGKRGGPPSPADIAPRLIESHDANGDGELNTEELLQALKSMHDRRGGGRPQRRSADSE